MSNEPRIAINRLAIKPGTIDEFIEARHIYASSLTEKPTGLIGSRLYRGLDGRTVVLVSQFESIKAQEEIRQLPHSTQTRSNERSQLAGVCDNLCLAARNSLILNGEMSEWLSSFAASPLRRDISP